jgi:tetratricopeptide (TPR) repeat protein
VEKVPLFALSLASCVVTWYAQTDAISSLQRLPFAARLANALLTYWAYIGQMFWPVDLCIYYPHPGTNFSGLPATLAGLSLAIVSVLAVRLGRRWPYVPVGWFWYLGTLVPVIGLVQVGAQARADRYTYVPFIGLFILATWAIADLAARWRVEKLAAGAAGVVLLLCALDTWLQLHYWHDPVTLWTHTVEVTTDNALAHSTLGLSLFERGDLAGAAEHYQAALRIDPRYVGPHVNLGILLHQIGKEDEALRHYQAALQINPNHAEAHYNLGVLLFTQGKLDQAEREFRAALQADPGYMAAHNNLGQVLFQEGKLDEAVRHYRLALEMDPSRAEPYYNLGEAFAKQQKWDQAAGCYREAVRLQPGVASYRTGLGRALLQQGHTRAAEEQYREALRLPQGAQAVNREAWDLATAADPTARNGALALQLARTLCQGTQDQNPDMLDTLAAAYADIGNFVEAAAAARKALARAVTDPALTKELEARLRLYESGRPFRATQGEDASRP